MPTVPTEPAQPVPAAPHQARQMAESFGVGAERYERARPRYPDALIDRIVAGNPRQDVLDVGCGTGIAGRQLRAAGCTVLGVEPDRRMAEVARTHGLTVEVATFEDWQPTGRTFDAVIAAQAWHWVDPVTGPAKAAEILRPGGRLAIFGHVFEPPAEVAEPFAAAYRRAVPDSPFGDQPARRALDTYRRMYAAVADQLRQNGCFGEPEQRSDDWTRTYSRAEWLEFLPTTGGLTRLEPGPLAQILDAVGAAIDDLGGSFTMETSTLTVAAVRSAG